MLPPTLPAHRRTLSDAHARLDYIESQAEKTLLQVQAAGDADIKHTAALDKLTIALTELQTTMASVVRDSEEGRKAFEKILGQVLQDKAVSWLKLGVGTAVVGAPAWAPFLWKIFHG